MTKKKFLEKLEKRLSILNEDEKKDILLEYKGIIEEKVKHGMKEEDAVSDFGDFDQFVAEILSAYKIDPHMEAGKSESKEQSILETGEELIHKCAKKLSDVVEKGVESIKDNQYPITMELVFELLLKGICALLIMGFLTLPFLLLSRIGVGILDFTIFPINHILKFIWRIIISLFYFFTCFFLIFTIFKGYIRKPDESSIKKEEKGKTQTQKKEDKRGKEEKRENEKIVSKKGNSMSSLITIFLKLFIIFCFLIPVWICIFCGFIGFAVVFYFFLQGIHVIGILICILSFLTFLILLSKMLYGGIFHNTRIRLYPFLITFIAALIGIVMTVDFFTSLSYIDRAPDASTNTKNYVIDFEDTLVFDDSFVLIIDNTVPDYQAVVEATYYDDYINIEKRETIDREMRTLYISLDTNHESSISIYQLALQNLRKNKIYRYDKLENISVVVKVNERMQKHVQGDFSS